MKTKLSEYYDGTNLSTTADLIKFLLMPFVFFALLGFPGKFGSRVSTLCNFAALAFFVFCGFFTLGRDDVERREKIKRTLARSSLFFAIIFVFYLVVNLIYLESTGSLIALSDPEFLNKHTFFNFFVLNVWNFPVGNSIWFAHSLVYAYLFFLVAEKIRLNKFYLPLAIVFTVFMILSGELAKTIGFPYFGYRYIPGGAFTKAVPCMLIGGLIRRYVDSIGRIPRFVFIILFFVGIGMTLGEFALLSRMDLLVYKGNSVGGLLSAVSVCCFAVTKPDTEIDILRGRGGGYARLIYILCQPLAFVLQMIFVGSAAFPTIKEYSGIICFGVCLFLVFVLWLIRTRNEDKLDAFEDD